MRCFIAVDLPEEIKDEVTKFAGILKERFRKTRWVARENLHLTLKFLGETENSKVLELVERLKEAAADQAIFKAGLSGFGVFPSLKTPSILWVGLHDGEAQFKCLVQTVETAMASFGFARNTALFSAHVTIGRNKDIKRHEYTDINKADFCFRSVSSFLIDRFTLYQSILRPEGPLYHKLADFPLRSEKK